MAKFRTVAVSNVDELIGKELLSLEKAARRIAARLRGLHPTVQGSITIKLKARIHDPRRGETVRLMRQGYARVGVRQARGVK